MPRRPRLRQPSYITYRRGRWEVRFRYRDSSGVARWPSAPTPYTAADDERLAAAWALLWRARWIETHEEELRTVAVERAAGPTLGQLLDAWEADCRERGVAIHREAHRLAVLRATLGARTLVSELTVSRVLAWRAALRDGRSLGARSQNAYTTSLQAALNLAVRHGVLDVNPLRFLGKLPEVHTARPALTEHQVEALFRAIPAWEAANVENAAKWRKSRMPRVPLLTRLHLGYWTGGRPEAIDALRWRDVDLRAGVVVFPSSKAHRVVCPIEPPLRAHLRARLRDIYAGADDYVLASPEGGGPVNNWRHAWRQLIAAANAALDPHEQIAPTTPLHLLRHTRITHLLTAGVSPQAVAQATGTSPAMLWRHYAHLLAGALEAEMGRARTRRPLAAIGRAARPRAGQHSGQTTAPKAPLPARQAKPN